MREIALLRSDSMALFPRRAVPLDGSSCRFSSFFSREGVLLIWGFPTKPLRVGGYHFPVAPRNIFFFFFLASFDFYIYAMPLEQVTGSPSGSLLSLVPVFFAKSCAWGFLVKIVDSRHSLDPGIQLAAGSVVLPVPEPDPAPTARHLPRRGVARECWSTAVRRLSRLSLYDDGCLRGVFPDGFFGPRGAWKWLWTSPGPRPPDVPFFGAPPWRLCSRTMICCCPTRGGGIL